MRFGPRFSDPAILSVNAMTDTPAWDAADRAALLERATKLATDAGLTLPEGAVDKLDASGVSIFFHHHQSDAEVLTRLQAICKPAQAADTPASPHAAATHDPAFLAWLGGLAEGFDKMPALRRMQLERDFKSGVRASTTPAPTGVDTSKMTPQQKLDYALASNQTTKTARVAPVAETPAMRGMTGQQRSRIST